VVNNNAAAVLLALHSLARGMEVIVSRGELVEIGGSFRMPDVMKISQAKMVEVGTTNKTHLSDYEQAISPRTAAILVVHPSNYQIIGFTSRPELKDLLDLAQRHQLPIIYDLGSGALIDMQEFGLPPEPVVSELIACGVDILTFSGDKLLGGPQCGIIAGKEVLVKKIRQNHLLRALRCDKITLALLAGCLQKYLLSRESLVENCLALKLISRGRDELRIIAETIVSHLQPELRERIKVVETEGRVGSGAYPVFPLPSLSLQIALPRYPAGKIALHFRKQQVPIIGYIENDSFYLNLQTLFQDDWPHLVSACNQLL